MVTEFGWQAALLIMLITLVSWGVKFLLKASFDAKGKVDEQRHSEIMAAISKQIESAGNTNEHLAQLVGMIHGLLSYVVKVDKEV